MTESHLRSVVKAVSWRTTGTIDTIVVSYFVTGQFKTALSIGFVEVFTKIGIYYVHERVWNKVKLGRKPTTDDYSI
ncbi:MAG: DUF2061 domain-containing protein [Candidatus Sumerlaeaceae bacterium]|nr:DUF2061 domain-containing protein [Candidatus Sumerlaeaceae bacterium]